MIVQTPHHQPVEHSFMGRTLVINPFFDKVLTPSTKPIAKVASAKLVRICSLLLLIDEISQPVPTITSLDKMSAVLEGLLFQIRSAYDLLLKSCPKTKLEPLYSFNEFQKKLNQNPELRNTFPETHGTLLPHAAFYDTFRFRNGIKDGRMYVMTYLREGKFHIRINQPPAPAPILDQELGVFITWQIIWLALTMNSLFLDIFGPGSINQWIKDSHHA